MQNQTPNNPGKRTEAEMDANFREHTRVMASQLAALSLTVMAERDLIASHLPDTRDPATRDMIKGAMLEVDASILLLDAVRCILCEPPKEGNHPVHVRIMAALSKWVEASGGVIVKGGDA